MLLLFSDHLLLKFHLLWTKIVQCFHQKRRIVKVFANTRFRGCQSYSFEDNQMFDWVFLMAVLLFDTMKPVWYCVVIETLSYSLLEADACNSLLTKSIKSLVSSEVTSTVLFYSLYETYICPFFKIDAHSRVLSQLHPFVSVLLLKISFENYNEDHTLIILCRGLMYPCKYSGDTCYLVWFFFPPCHVSSFHSNQKPLFPRETMPTSNDSSG